MRIYYKRRIYRDEEGKEKRLFVHKWMGKLKTVKEAFTAQYNALIAQVKLRIWFVKCVFFIDLSPFSLSITFACLLTRSPTRYRYHFKGAKELIFVHTIYQNHMHVQYTIGKCVHIVYMYICERCCYHYLPIFVIRWNVRKKKTHKNRYKLTNCFLRKRQST